MGVVSRSSILRCVIQLLALTTDIYTNIWKLLHKSECPETKTLNAGCSSGFVDS